MFSIPSPLPLSSFASSARHCTVRTVGSVRVLCVISTSKPGSVRSWLDFEHFGLGCVTLINYSHLVRHKKDYAIYLTASLQIHKASKLTSKSAHTGKRLLTQSVTSKQRFSGQSRRDDGFLKRERGRNKWASTWPRSPSSWTRISRESPET